MTHASSIIDEMCKWLPTVNLPYCKMLILIIKKKKNIFERSHLGPETLDCGVHPFGFLCAHIHETWLCTIFQVSPEMRVTVFASFGCTNYSSSQNLNILSTVICRHTSVKRSTFWQQFKLSSAVLSAQSQSPHSISKVSSVRILQRWLSRPVILLLHLKPPHPCSWKIHPLSPKLSISAYFQYKKEDS